jgi:1-acyl-sn-glycerol-3-phosphate acyltransferase
MLETLRRRQPGRSIARILWWHFLHYLCFLWFLTCYRFRGFGQRHIPATGPVLFVSNHQSFLDPIVVGLAAHHRQFYALARSTLFDHPILGWLIRSLNAVPVARGESDTAAMRKCLDVLAEDHALLVFPEGTRSLDGTTGSFGRGIALLIKRSGATVVPVAIEGAFAAWPKGRKLPRGSGRIQVMYGEPIPPSVLQSMKPDAALSLLRDRVESMRLQLAEHF